ncbi:OmpH family outer membrane protein [Fodinibius sediminis]|uniref:Periplasmic chaperone for outer membrane proteins Skp n=1 Tax=Fodinibius sediminis TaxID=1214077 RepID=A0A521E0H2_9BACT|nr:OmpH family outer membrane protein [Fodinibius sediminis]SMO77418.1 periplasmic chaperone for outer membrane proteins Skp [Fodinibius sediminis]
MLKRILSTSLLCLFFIGFAGTSSAQAQQLEIGYVDPQAILSRMPEMKAVQQRLQNFMEKKRNELDTKRQEYQQQVSQYQQKESVISESAKQKEEERLGQLGAELQEFQSQLQQEVQQKQQELVGPLLDQIDTAIGTVANDMGLTYVLNTTTSNGDVIILYASDEAQQKYDITDEVMAELDMQ